MRCSLRSNTGCLTCRRRRKKCDERHPNCGSCHRIGLECIWPGENKDISRGSTQLSLNIQDNEHSRLPTGEALWRFIERLGLPVTLKLDAFRSSICESFMFNVLAKAMNHSLDTIDSLSAMSLSVPLSHTAKTDGSLSRIAWQAYCFYTFGELHNLPESMAMGRRMCSRALQALYASSSDNTPTHKVEMLTTALWLGMFETRACTSRKAVIVHLIGMTELVTNLGPLLFADSRYRMLFENFRWGIVHMIVLTGRKSALSSDSWLTIPWHGSQKPFEQQLLDVMLCIPGLREILYQISSQDTSACKADDRREFWKKHGDILVRLGNWRHLHHNRVQVVDWYLPPHQTAEAEVFSAGVPLFASSIATIAMAWYYTILAIAAEAGAAACAVSVFSNNDNTESHMDILRQAENSSLGCYHSIVPPDQDQYDSTQDEIDTLWAAQAEQFLKDCRHAIMNACAVFVPFLRNRLNFGLLMHSTHPLLLATNFLSNDKLGAWAKQAYSELEFSKN